MSTREEPEEDTLKNATEQRNLSTLAYSIASYGETGLRKQNCCWGEREK